MPMLVGYRYPQLIPIVEYAEWCAKTLKWGIISIKWDEVVWKKVF